MPPNYVSSHQKCKQGGGGGRDAAETTLVNGAGKMSYTMSDPRQQSLHDNLDIDNNSDTIICDKWPGAPDP